MLVGGGSPPPVVGGLGSAGCVVCRWSPADRLGAAAAAAAAVV